MELTMQASAAHLAGLRRAVRDCLHEVPHEAADEVVLALNEAVTNAILYGSRGGRPVEVAVRVEGGWIEASVLDHGPARPVAEPSGIDGDGDGDRYRARGRGLWILRRLVDELRLERVGRGTRVTLRRRVRPPKALRR
jgi:anti-sigma regulatory factor (Ser/Thr protein kinase)